MYLEISIDNARTKKYYRDVIVHSLANCVRPPSCARYTGMFERGRANGDGELIRLSVQRHGVWALGNGTPKWGCSFIFYMEPLIFPGLRSFSVVGYVVVFCKITFSESTPMVIFQGWKSWSTMESIFGQTHRTEVGHTAYEDGSKWFKMGNTWEHQNPIGIYS